MTSFIRQGTTYNTSIELAKCKSLHTRKKLTMLCVYRNREKINYNDTFEQQTEKEVLCSM